MNEKKNNFSRKDGSNSKALISIMSPNGLFFLLKCITRPGRSFGPIQINSEELKNSKTSKNWWFRLYCFQG